MPHNLTLRRHAALVDRMAKTLGVDLEEAVMRGQMAPGALPDLVLRCTSCANPDGCEAWLDKQREASAAEASRPTTRAATTPYFCRNAGTFDVLERF